MNDKEQQTKARRSQAEPDPQQDEPVFNSEGVEVHPETVKAVRETAEQYQEVLKKLAKR